MLKLHLIKPFKEGCQEVLGLQHVAFTPGMCINIYFVKRFSLLTNLSSAQGRVYVINRTIRTQPRQGYWKHKSIETLFPLQRNIVYHKIYILFTV